MVEHNVDTIIENLSQALIFIHRKLLKIDFSVADKDISRPHFYIMRITDEYGKLPVSEIGKRLMIPKPQMTRFIDRLISLNMVRRLPDKRDRRIINIILTEKGKTTLEECKELIRNNIKSKLSSLSNEELEELSISLTRLVSIGQKVGQE